MDDLQGLTGSGPSWLPLASFGAIIGAMSSANFTLPVNPSTVAITAIDVGIVGPVISGYFQVSDNTLGQTLWVNDVTGSIEHYGSWRGLYVMEYPQSLLLGNHSTVAAGVSVSGWLLQGAQPLQYLTSLPLPT